MNSPFTIEMNNYTVNFKDQEAARRFVMWYSFHAKVVAELSLSIGESNQDDDTVLSLAFLQRDLNTLINQACSFIG